jgi:hypothetical protein
MGFIVLDPLNVDWIECFSMYLSVHASLTFIHFFTLPGVNVTTKILSLFLKRQVTVEPLARFEFLLGYLKFYSHNGTSGTEAL